MIAIVLFHPKAPQHFNNSAEVAPAPVAVVTQQEQPKVEPIAEKVQVPEPTPPTPQPAAVVQPAPPPAPVVTGSHEDWLTAAGIPRSDWEYVNYIVNRESSWNYKATNSSSGAYGLCQSLPASKMASAGTDWKDNPVTQLRWCHQYAMGRYKTWLAAFNFWQSRHWW